MSRVSTHGNYQSALLDLMAAQQRNADANKRVTTQKNATDLIGFGRESATINALKTTQTRTDAYIEVNKTVLDRLEIQDLAMGRISEAATNARLAIANAVSAGRMDGLMAELEIQFKIAADALNTKHQGQFLFSGGVMNEAPSNVSELSELGVLANADLAFSNGTLKQASRLDDNVVMDTGFLANEMGSELYALFHQVQTLHNANPLEGRIEGAMDQTLRDLMQSFSTAAEGLVDKQARNGIHQSRIEKLLTDHEARAISVEVMLADKTDADMAKAVSDLEMSQVMLQASAQVINQLRQVSLLDYLR